MKLDEAKAECARWFAYIDRQRERSIGLQKLAADRRAGLDDAEKDRRLRAIDRSVTVYDGANLEQAVRVLLKHVK